MSNTTSLDEKPQGVAFAQVNTGLYAVIVAVFASLLFMSNIAATKGVEFGPIFGDFSIITDGGFFLFPLAYILGGILAEVYGFKAARRAVYVGFGVAVFAALSFWIVAALPPASFYENQEAFSTVVGVYPQILLASLAAFLVGLMLNSFIIVRIKERTLEKHLWARLMGSTVVGQFVDTFIFCAIAATAIGIATTGDFLNYLIVGFLYKTAAEALLLPVTYRVVAFVKRHEPTYQPV
ncbi:queuosine precursor transporter [Hoyosella rhizosphaerae]|uniref:Probable queuosine precursor transporter n=1 Tax=Hoyosella rhizosphaerae TaxID=1755582 RepID=A0A916UJX1_9ACTN|nr:queuosine precursor transporter [Hoyosella rhizosphaerae]MBN4925417.1 queuosine precursor transporter [Hoyosella rhizosphaerae]GGC75345.1 membrane protein [Hoyosella rhizosphaerae]